MLTIENLQPGKSYACKFTVETLLDEDGNPAPNLSNKALKGIGSYSSIGILMMRDFDKKLVKLLDETTKLQYIVPFENIWDIDTVEWIDPFENDPGDRSILPSG